MLFESSRLKLRKMTLEDAELYHKWRNDLEVMYSTNPILDVYPVETTKEFVEQVILGSNNAKSYIIVEKENERSIGVVSLTNIDYKNRNAECIIDIGEKEYWGNGFGSEALRLLLEYAFYEMNPSIEFLFEYFRLMIGQFVCIQSSVSDRKETVDKVYLEMASGMISCIWAFYKMNTLRSGYNAMEIIELPIEFEFNGQKQKIYPSLIVTYNDLTLVDTGYPNFLPLIENEIIKSGYQMQNLKNIIITHYDDDHIGSLYIF